MKKLIYLLTILLTLASCALDKVDTGSAPGAGDGEILYTGFNKINVTIDTVQYILYYTDTLRTDIDNLQVVKMDSIYNLNSGEWLVNLDTIDLITTTVSPVDTLTVTDSLTVGLITNADTIRMKSGGYDILFNLDSLVGALVNARFKTLITESIISDTSIVGSDTTTGGIAINTVMNNIDSINVNNSGVFGLPRYASDPTTTRTGFMYYNTASNEVRFWNGSSFVAL